MKKLFLSLFISLFCTLAVHAQVADSGAKKVIDIANKKSTSEAIIQDSNKSIIQATTPNKKDRTKIAKDSTKNVSAQAANGNNITLAIEKNLIPRQPLLYYFPDWFYHRGVEQDASLINLHEEENSGDISFYCLLGILLFTGLIRTIFPKYFHQIFQFILQPRVRKNNLRDGNIVDNIMPSILLNILFVITFSLFIVQLAISDFTITEGWKYWTYCALAIAIIYIIKYNIIKFSGWIFSAQPAASIYNYVVFSINKILGVVLIPIIILAAYSSISFVSTMYSVASVIIIGLLAYRYLASFILLRGNLKVSVFHFFIYLCAIEILPLLVTYKILSMKFGPVI